MRVVLASSNRGKIAEIKALLPEKQVVFYGELIREFEIEENGDSFQANATIKARAVYEALLDEDAVVISDDSGISIEAFGWEPNIFSARYAGANASDQANIDKVLRELKARGLAESKAFYTACMAIVCKYGEFTVHGWLYGKVISDKKGTNGFGYDPIFVPDGYDKTVAELDQGIKATISHRAKALENLQALLKAIF